MLSERVDAVLPLQSSFLRPYAEYASQCCDAPDLYHVGVGLTMLAGTIAKSLACPFMAGRVLVPNLYTLIVGPSRSARKTASMDMGISIVQIASPETVIPIPGSYEELIMQLRATPTGLLTYREFGHFLKTTARGYGEPIRTVLMDLFDWPPNRSYTRNLRKGKTVIDPMICLSMIGAVSTDLMFKFTDSEDWTGGFFGRMILLYGERENFRMPLTWPEAESHLANILHQWVHAAIPPCGGFTPDAWAFFAQWAQYRDGQTNTAPGRVTTFVSGATTLAAKVALLYAADCGEPFGGQGWLISLATLTRAIRFVDDLYLPSVYHLGNRLTIGPWETDRQRVLDGIERSSSRGILRQDLLKHVKMSSEYLDQHLNTLRDEGTIVQIKEARGVVLKKAPEGTLIPFPPTSSGGGAGSNSNSGGQVG